LHAERVIIIHYFLHYITRDMQLVLGRTTISYFDFDIRQMRTVVNKTENHSFAFSVHAKHSETSLTTCNVIITIRATLVLLYYSRLLITECSPRSRKYEYSSSKCAFIFLSLQSPHTRARAHNTLT
jgi:hypothetical protein